MKTTFALTTAALLALSSMPASAAELLQNGQFSADLNGWTSFVTSNGNIAELPSTPGSPQPQAAQLASFNVTGSGASSALFLNVGAVNPPYGAAQQGGGVFQSFTSLGGTASFSASIAAFSRTGNLSAGIFSVLLDDVVMASFDFGEIASLATERSSLNFTTNLSAGTHTISLMATRAFGPGRTVNAQYFDNVSFDQTVSAAVPEPASWAMMIGGFALIGATLRGNRRVSLRFA